MAFELQLVTFDVQHAGKKFTFFMREMSGIEDDEIREAARNQVTGVVDMPTVWKERFKRSVEIVLPDNQGKQQVNEQLWPSVPNNVRQRLEFEWRLLNQPDIETFLEAGRKTVPKTPK